MDVNEKLQQFGQSLEEISNKEYKQIEQDVDNEIKTGIEEEIKEYLDIATSLGLSALVEAHTEEEVKMALICGAKIIGVNNRNLKDFTVDINNCINLRKLVPENILFVGESGIKTSTDIANLKKANVNAVLIGETLMRSEDKSKALTELNGEPLYK